MSLGASFWRMSVATASSDLADGIGRTALPLAAASYTRNPVLISALTTFAFLPWLLFALPSGALVDRVDRRYAMAAANVVRAIAGLLLAAILYFGTGSIALLYVVAFVFGVAETVYDSAVRALLPNVVERSDLDRANSIVTVEETLGQTFAGALLGSLLFTVAIALPFLLGAAGFAVAVVLIVTLRGQYRPQRTSRASMRSEAAEGVRWLRRHDLLRPLTLISAANAFGTTMINSVLVLYVLEVLRLPAGDFGLVLVVAGLGEVIGSIATPPLARRFGRPVLLTAGSALTAIATVLMATTRNGYVGAALFAASAAGIMTWNVLTMSLRQALIPPELFGRVQGSYRTLVWGLMPLGALTGGGLAAAFGVRSAFVVSGALGLVMTVALGRLLHRHADAVGDEQLAAELPAAGANPR